MMKKRKIYQNLILLKGLLNGYMMKLIGLEKKGGFLLWVNSGRNLRVLVVMAPGTSLSAVMQRGTIGLGAALGVILIRRSGKRGRRLDTYRNNYGDSSRLRVTPSQVKAESGRAGVIKIAGIGRGRNRQLYNYEGQKNLEKKAPLVYNESVSNHYHERSL